MTAYAYYPSSNPVGGDAFFNTVKCANPEMGNYAYITILHELGHALGLKHPHELDGGGQVPIEWDSMEFTVMSYRSFVGKSLTYGYANEKYGFSQSLMMLDIAAIQRMYGADFSANSDDTTYSFNILTGAMSVGGLEVAKPGANRVFRTIWDGNGTDTYDFSNYLTDLAVDLTPGGYTDLDVGGTFQRAMLEDPSLDPNGVYGLTEQYARGHVFNAMTYNGDSRSLIENAKGGSGNDTFIGNAANNTFWGGAGDDTFFDSAGSDTYDGDSGNDVVIFAAELSFFSYIYNTTSSMLELAGDAIDYVFNTVEELVFNGTTYTFDYFSGAPVADTDPPTVVSFTIDDTLLAIGETGLVTIRFSEAVSGFDADDIDLEGAAGTLDGLTSADNITWTATFTPTTGVEVVGQTIAVSAGGYTDIALNSGTAGLSNTFAIDTLAPGARATVTSVTSSGGATAVTGTLDGVLADGDVLTILRDGSPVGTATVNSTDWSFDDVSLGGGTYVYTALVNDAAGNDGPPSDPFPFQVEGPIAGTDGSDPMIVGTTGNDILSGVPDTSTSLGAGTIDVFFGNGGADHFVFGDSRGVFYDDGNDRAGNTGKSDYGLIRSISSDGLIDTPFTAGEDTIQLAGTSADYFLLDNFALDGFVGTAIVYDSNGSGQPDQKDELIGLVEGIASLSLETDFIWV